MQKNKKYSKKEIKNKIKKYSEKKLKYEEKIKNLQEKLDEISKYEKTIGFKFDD